MDSEYKDIQKMIFIFNALNDGWTVRKIDNNKFELIKNNEIITKEINNKKYLFENEIKYIGVDFVELENSKGIIF